MAIQAKLALASFTFSARPEREEILEKGEAPLLLTLPLPLTREGGQGDRLLSNLFIALLTMLLTYN